ncbi:MAG: leucine-rich repeat domain-containing protein [Cytophagaceae bacterium]|jgi:Leucine-rich repeat (LRR) protein|nr:leucine-rich repeat domain-containing protein [Cytophagaceae bacterium]
MRNVTTPLREIVLVCILFLSMAVQSKAALVTIPDANFRAYLKQQYPGCFSGDLMETTCSAVVNAIVLDCSGKSISNLTGISYFINLKELNCSYNPLASLPSLPTSLTHLRCSFNQLTSLPPLPNSLKVLHCSNNQLTSLPTLPNSLKVFYCSNNQLTSLPTLPTSLTHLDCLSNSLTILPTLPVSLIWLDCSLNSLTSLPPLPNSLEVLFCSNNQLTSLPTLPTSLTHLYCLSNSLTILPTLPVSLIQLDCSINSLTSLPTLPTSLTHLYCYSNSLTILPTLPVSLIQLDCYLNSLTSLPPLPTSLTLLYCFNNSLTILPTLPVNLDVLNCANNQITSLPTLPNSLLEIRCFSNPLSSLPNLPTELTYLMISPNQISCLPPNRPEGLQIYTTEDGTSQTLITLPDCPPLSVTSTQASTYCRSAAFNISYTVPSPYPLNNIFTAVLVQPANPNFTPINVGSVVSSTSGTIAVTLPSTVTTAGDYALLVRASNGSQSLPTTTFAIINPTSALAISGPSSVCPQQSGISFGLPTITGATYSWSIPSGTTLVSGQGTSTISVNWGSSIGNISGRLNSSCGTGVNNTKPITLHPTPRVTIPVSGPISVCANQTYTYSINPIVGATYQWIVPASLSLLSGQGTSSISVRTSTVSATIQIIETTPCGASTSTLALTLQTPRTGLTITGNTSVCPLSTALSYSVSNANPIATYVWTLPTGASLVSGQNSSSIVVNWGTVAGNISVVETTLCGSAPATNVAVSLRPSPRNTLSISGSLTNCANTTYTYTVASPIAGATYTWSTSTGNTVLTPNGTNSISVRWGSTSGTVSVTEATSCGTGSLNSLTVALLPAPNNSLSVVSPSKVCANSTGNQFSVANASANASYGWVVPSGCTIISGQGTSTITVSWNAQSGVVSVREQNVCGIGSFVNTTVNLVNDYTFGPVEPVCGNIFALPILVNNNFSGRGIIGIDFTVFYDPALYTPSTSSRIGSTIGEYGAVTINTAQAGRVIMSIYLVNAPAGTYFNGVGEVICLWFNPTAAATAGTISNFSMSNIEESTPVQTLVACAAPSYSTTIKSGIPARISYRSTTLNMSSVGSALPMEVMGTNTNCLPVQPSITLYPNSSGVFSYVSTYGSQLQLKRDIKGDIQVPTIQCSSVQSVINSSDRLIAADISTQRIANPSIYELLSADVNLDGKVTAGDVSLISSRSINANNCEFPQTNYIWNGTALVPGPNYKPSKDWIFVTDALLTSPAFTTNISRNNVPRVPECLPAPTGTPSCSTVANVNYRAILLGDVNGSWNPTSINTMRQLTSQALLLDMSTAVVMNNGNWMIPVRPMEEQSYRGLDITLEEVPGTEIIRIHKNPHQEPYGLEYHLIEQKRLMLTAYSETTLDAQQAAFYLEVSSAGLSPSLFTHTAAYIDGEEVEISYQSSVAGSNTSIDIHVFPNPTDGKELTMLVEDSKEAVTVRILYTDGRIYKELNVPTRQEYSFALGLTAGIYLISIETSKGTEMRKLVVQ